MSSRSRSSTTTDAVRPVLAPPARSPRRPLRRGVAATILLTGLGLGGCADPGSPPNVLLITVDTLRADHLSGYGYDRPTSPRLDALAAQGHQFLRAYAQSNSTNPAHLSILSGLTPRTHGVQTLHDPFPEDLTLLPGRLAAAGYRTAGFISARHLYNFLGAGPEGFAHFPGPPTASQLPADVMTDAALTWIETSAGRPFFLWLHYFDPHGPYAPPPPFASRFTGTGSRGTPLPTDVEIVFPLRDATGQALRTLEPYRDAYDGEIAFVDDQIGRLLQHGRDRGWKDRTLIIVTADHGESLGEHGIYFDHAGLYEPTVHVPLLIKLPGADRPGRSDALVQHTDLAPTILDVLGLEAPAGLEGRSLVPLMHGGAPPHERLILEASNSLEKSIITPEWKFIYHGTWTLGRTRRFSPPDDWRSLPEVPIQASPSDGATLPVSREGLTITLRWTVPAGSAGDGLRYRLWLSLSTQRAFLTPFVNVPVQTFTRPARFLHWVSLNPDAVQRWRVVAYPRDGDAPVWWSPWQTFRLQPEGRLTDQLYHRIDDPGETDNRADAHQPRCEQWAQELETWYAQRPVRPPAPPPSPELLRQLRALGYTY